MMLNDNHFADVSKMIETPPLTAELSSNPLQLMLEWLCDNGGLDYLSITPEDIAEAASDIAKAYAAQQTAAKDARIEELEKENKLLRTGKLEWAEPMGYTTYQDVLADLGKAASVRAERDALQSQLDTANAQLAMVREELHTAYIEACDLKDNHPPVHHHEGLTMIINIWHRYFLSPQPTTEQWLADRDAALLKPWREAVQVLREACELDPTRFPLMEEKAVMLAIRYNTDPVTILEDFSELTYEALKATEDLQ